jgi:hypothetical protein
LVEKECPNAIEEVESDRLQIRIHKIDKKTFIQINALIDTFLKVKETNQENLNQIKKEKGVK